MQSRSSKRVFRARRAIENIVSHFSPHFDLHFDLHFDSHIISNIMITLILALISIASIATMVSIVSITSMISSCGLADAAGTASVGPGQSIQSAIDVAVSGGVIEVQNGTYYESLNVNKPLTLKGIGWPIIDARGIGSAITLSANGSILTGLTATGSGNGDEDAGILVLSSGNVIRANEAVGNANHGIMLIHAHQNTVFLNEASENGNSGLLLVHSNDNQIWGNNAGRNLFGITLESCRSNTIKGNTIREDAIGINISNFNIQDSVKAHGKGVLIGYNPSSEAETYNIDKNSTAISAGINHIHQNEILECRESAFDDGNNQWYGETGGNHYSDFDSREEGCRDRNRDGICDAGHAIPGGRNVDELPVATEDAILSYSARGQSGLTLKMEQRNFLSGEEITVKYVAAENLTARAEVFRAGQEDGAGGEGAGGNGVARSGESRLSGRSGTLFLMAPSELGSYEIRVHNETDGQLTASLGFGVRAPAIEAGPSEVHTCEKIQVNFSGAPGFENDWIGMYLSGGPDSGPIARLYLDGNENGSVTLTAPDPGSYEFRMFENDSLTRLAVSNPVVASAYKGTKVVASPTKVAPGGVVTVTYWGAPASGSGMIGLYGMNRPDKFPIEKRGIGGKNCGSISWRLPSSPGQYDFRMFYSDITSEGQGAYQLLGQTDVVTVG